MCGKQENREEVCLNLMPSLKSLKAIMESSCSSIQKFTSGCKSGGYVPCHAELELQPGHPVHDQLGKPLRRMLGEYDAQSKLLAKPAARLGSGTSGHLYTSIPQFSDLYSIRSPQ